LEVLSAQHMDIASIPIGW